MDHPLVCEWRPCEASLSQRGMRVIVDESAGTVTFERCHRSRRFWTIHVDDQYTCRLDELQAVHQEWWLIAFFYQGWTVRDRNIYVSTPHGKAIFNSRMTGCDNVVSALNRHVRVNRGPLLENPNCLFVGTMLLMIAMSVLGLIWAFFW